MQELLEPLNNIILDLNKMLPQFADFIAQFNNTVIQHGVNVLTDTEGNMSIDVPNNMSEVTYNHVSHKLGVIDRLISSQESTISGLFKKGLELEQQIRLSDNKYQSRLIEEIAKFKELNASYIHKSM